MQRIGRRCVRHRGRVTWTTTDRRLELCSIRIELERAERERRQFKKKIKMIPRFYYGFLPSSADADWV